MRVAFCDDSMNDIAKIKQIICRMVDYSFDYDVYISPLELIRCLYSGLRYDLYLLDIEMPEKSGISLARKIRELDTKALLVFLTSYTKY
ncbi:MAG: response regulator, partial [Suipraeoptans sp.]